MRMAMYTITLWSALTACQPSTTPAETAEASYAAQQAACIDKFKTKPEIDACRDQVKKDWAPADAGRDGAK